MPVTVHKKGNKYRVVEKSTGRLARRNGTPVDGGGHSTKVKARQQAKAINMSEK